MDNEVELTPERPPLRKEDSFDVPDKRTERDEADAMCYTHYHERVLKKVSGNTQTIHASDMWRFRHQA